MLGSSMERGDVTYHQHIDHVPGYYSRALPDQSSAAGRTRQADRPGDRHHYRRPVAAEIPRRLLTVSAAPTPGHFLGNERANRRSLFRPTTPSVAAAAH